MSRDVIKWREHLKELDAQIYRKCGKPFSDYIHNLAEGPTISPTMNLSRRSDQRFTTPRSRKGQRYGIVRNVGAMRFCEHK